MKQKYTSLLVFIGLLLCSGIHAQITVSNETFPSIGDTLFTRTTFNAAGIDVGSPGADQFWNMEGLSGGQLVSTLYLDPAMGNAAADFPEAELMSTQGGITEIYYDVFNNRMDELGRAGQDFGFGDIDIPFIFEEKPVFRRAPIAYGDAYDNDNVASVTVGIDIFPDSLLTLLGPFADLIDSVRVNVDISNSASVDAWGTIVLPNGSYETLRERVETIQDTKLFIRAFGAWNEAGPEILTLLGPAADFFGRQEFTTYNFYSDVEKEILVSANVQDGALISITYKGDGIVTSTKQLTYTDAEISAYPNPTFGPITFDVGAYGNGKYRLTVYNIVGKQIITDSFEVTNNQSFETNLSQLRKGSYIYTIHNERGDKLGTKRFIILKP